MTIERITAAVFTDKTRDGVYVKFDTEGSLTADSKAVLTVDGRDTEVADVGILTHNSGSVVFASVTDENFDFTAEYAIRLCGTRKSTAISKFAFTDDKDFIELFECEDSLNCTYGSNVTAEGTVFRVWAPFASAVTVRIYGSGTGGKAECSFGMNKRYVPGTKRWGGVWDLVLDDCYSGKYYTYLIVNNGSETETVDPYAKACGVNGTRGMIVDLESTDPAGWENDRHLYETHPDAADVPIVWEVHVGDFSSSSDSGMKYKGKYLAFTEENTSVPGLPDLKTGVNYLKDLGITYVHLNPVYDFATVDESDMSKADNSKDNFNWGYDPQNYNIPEGSYSTDPTDGKKRINEFKRMVMALHNAGIGVIMDVVYNHTYSTNGQALHDTVPYYYHRTDGNGAFTDGSGCGNETASERGMMRKYIIDSLLYWATEYHIDGFRFDLMGIHDSVTVSMARDALDALDGGNGKKLLMYGEPWSADGNYVPASFCRRITASGELSNALVKNSAVSSLPLRVAVFNDDARDGMRGNNDPGWGWVQGNAEKTGAVAAMLNGTAKNPGSASRNVVYASAHDNYPLWDQLIGKRAGTETPLFYENRIADNVKKCKLVSAAYLMSPGIAFMLAGEEIARTKYGNHNSYDSPAKLNGIKWARQVEFADLYDHYKTLIKARRANREKLFSYSLSAAGPGYTCGTFAADGLKVSGCRGDLKVALDAEDLSGWVRIGDETVAEI